MSCACLRVFECKNAPFNPDKLGTVLTLLGRGDTQDPARTQRDLFRFCHNAIPMYVGLAATHGLLSAGGEPGGVCASVLYLPSDICIYYIYTWKLRLSIVLHSATTIVSSSTVIECHTMVSYRAVLPRWAQYGNPKGDGRTIWLLCRFRFHQTCAGQLSPEMILLQEPSAGPVRQATKDSFAPPFFLLLRKPIIYQDRLGTNATTTEGQGVIVSQEAKDPAAAQRAAAYNAAKEEALQAVRDIMQPHSRL